MTTNERQSNTETMVKPNDRQPSGKQHLSDETLMEIEAFDTEYILRLTKAALIAGSIPNDDTIVPFIGEGYETDNSKAVESWIRNNIDMLVNIAPQNQIEKIIEEIDNRISEVKTGYLGWK